MTTDLSALRLEYATGALDESNAPSNPLELFNVWMDQALASQLREPTAMSLATVNPDGAPDCRMVLLKGFNEDGFLFYTNYLSAKGRQIDACPQAALVLYWAELERQVRIRGRVSRITSLQSDTYFYSRPWKSRLGAAASPQSRSIPSRAWLEDRFAALEAANTHETLHRPAHWGGYLVVPNEIEFWQGRRSRLHDRLLYTRTGAASRWTVARLAP